MSWLFDKKLRTEAGQLFNRFWWVLVGVGVLTAKKPTPINSFTCDRLRIYNRQKFQNLINKYSNEIIKELNISFDDHDPGLKFEEVSLTTVGILGIYKLNVKCLNPNKILDLKTKLPKAPLDGLSNNQKILYYILGIEFYEHIKDLNFGTIGFYSEKTKNWQEIELPKQLKNYREFLGMDDAMIDEVEKAYNQIVATGKFP